MNCQWESFENKFKCKNCGKVVPRNTIKRNCDSVAKTKVQPPGMGARVMNLAQAAAHHVVTGFQHCTKEQKQDRYNKCSENACGFFVKRDDNQGVCAHSSCGCFIRSGGKFMDKLSWASSSCPVGRWGPVENKLDENTEKGV